MTKKLLWLYRTVIWQVFLSRFLLRHLGLKIEIAKMTWLEVGKYLQTTSLPTVIVPISPVEEHGPHLPCSVDFLLTECIAKRAAQLCGCLVYPTIPLMCCGISKDSPGTLAIDETALAALTRSLTRELARKGFKRIIFASVHFGFSIDVISRAIQEEGFSPDSMVKVVRLVDVTIPLIPPGVIETSGMLFRFPRLVRHRRLFWSRMPAADYHQVDEKGKPVQCSQSGINGNPKKATWLKGWVITRAAISGFASWIINQGGHSSGKPVNTGWW